MLMTIAFICLLLWGLGLMTGSMLGGFLHILLVVTAVMVFFRMVQGSRIM